VDVEGATARPPSRWDPNLTPLHLGLLFDLEKYGRCCLYGESYVTSRIWQATKSRDNQWIVFQHHVHEYAYTVTSEQLPCTEMYG
jgi:hypothetical protein